ncbi:MAG TPA: LCP family protein [Nocardioidaceae bacterium]
MRRITQATRGTVGRSAARLRRTLPLVLVLALTALVVPQSSVREAPAQLVRVQSAHEVASRDVVWVLMLGSDARPGQPVLRSRADAIQLVGINTRTQSGITIGIPRDSYVNIPGHGRNKINAAMLYGGPQLMGRAVGDMVGIRPQYVFTTSFWGFSRMVDSIGGVTVDSKYAFSDPVRPQGYKVGKNKLNGIQAMIFSRLRKPFPGGDFDRSANQQRTLEAVLRQVRENDDRRGFMERGVMSVLMNLDTPNARPADLYRLAHAAARIKPQRFRGCVISGSVGNVGAASVVFPNIGQARSIANRVRRDATLEGGC